MLTKLRPEFKYSPLLTISILMAFLIVWSTLYLRIHIDADIGWLLECLDRFMAGGTYTNDFYETNPPLNFWIYLPAHIFYTYFALDPKLSVFVNVLSYLMISNLTFFYLLRKEKHVKALDLLVIISAILMAQSWATGDIYGLKDHLISSFLLPISLYQYRLTRSLKSGTILATSSIILGGIAICLKPHYAFIPALFFAHRLYTTRSLTKCITAPDFWGMLIIGIAYFVAIYLSTPEFFDILPQVISVYSVEKPFPLSDRYHYILYALFASLGAYFLFSDSDQEILKKSVYSLSALSLVCLVPYILQNKGYHSHSLPLLCFGASAAFIMIYGMIKELTKSKSDIALWGACAAMVVLFGGYTYGNKVSKLTKKEFLAMPIVKTIDELAWNDTYTIMYEVHSLANLPKMSSLKSGTRFGALWPLTGLAILVNKTEDPEMRKKYKKKMYEYVDMMAKDIKRNKPSVILIPQYPTPETLEPNKDYYNFLMKHESFKENMSNYTFYDTVVFDTSYAPEGKNMDPLKLVPHDIYVLKHDNTL